MKILHLLPAAFKTLFSVYWFNACNFCTIDVNNTKKSQESCRNKNLFTLMWIWDWCLQQTMLKALFCAENYQTSLPNNAIIIKLWLSPGPNHTSRYFCTNKCQCFLLFLLIDWLDFFDNGTWHLLWLKFVGNLISALQWKVKWSYHKIRRYKLWIKPSTHAQWWAILGYTNLLLFFVSKVFKGVLMFWGIF